MKVLMLNGSSHVDGSTYTALTEVGRSLVDEGIEYEIFQMGAKPIVDCIDCGKCYKLHQCAFDDIVNQFVEKAYQSDGFIFGTPVYYAHPSGRVLSMLDRAFYSSQEAFKYKPASAVAVARRGGTTASLDVLNKYFGISQMPVVSSSYWNMIHGNKPSEVLQDLEGIQTMHNIGKNMAWLLKSLDVAKHNGIRLPSIETGHRTDYIR